VVYIQVSSLRCTSWYTLVYMPYMHPSWYTLVYMPYMPPWDHERGETVVNSLPGTMKGRETVVNSLPGTLGRKGNGG